MAETAKLVRTLLILLVALLVLGGLAQLLIGPA